MAGNVSSMNTTQGGHPSCNQENCCNGRQLNSSAECCSRNDKPDFPKETKIILISVKAILIIVIVLGNSLVFKAFHKFLSLRTASNVILVSLCVADSSIVIPFILQISLMALWLSSTDPQAKPVGINFLHVSTAWISLLVVSVIILHLALISVERFIAVKFSLRYHTIVTKRRALIASIALWLWVVAVTIVIPQVLRTNSDDAYKRLRLALFPPSKIHKGPREDLSPSTTGYLIFLVTSLLVVPLVIILCSYGYIFIVSHKHRKQIREQDDIQGISTMKREMRGARTLAIVVAVCFLSIVPLLVVTSLRFFGKLPDRPECHPRNRKYIKYVVYNVAFFLNATCSPFIYFWRNEQFRSAFRKLLKPPFN